MFALLTAAEFTFKGINLPVREIYETGNIIISSRNNLELYGILLYHLLLLCTLLAAALIEIDRHQAAAASVFAGLGDWRNCPVDLAISAAGACLAVACRIG